MKEARKLNESDIKWMQNNSSIKGKINYKVVFKNLNLMKNIERP